MKKVFGVGFPRTGTKTLNAALTRLGYRVRSCDLAAMSAAFITGDVLMDVLRSYDAAEDLPWNLLFVELERAFPDARFVLTTRPPSDWLRSYRTMIVRSHDPAAIPLRSFLFGYPAKHLSDAIMVARYERHNEDVRRHFADSPRFVELSWPGGDGWDELCRFLEKPVPPDPFPWKNRSK